MPAPAARRGIASAAPVSAPATSGPGGPNINPETGLSTDYLNHFSEAVMVLELIGTMPECLDELRAWRPKSYPEHFATSRFSNRDAIVDAYRGADPAVRAALEAISVRLNATVSEARERMLRHAGTPEVEAIARGALDKLRPLLASMAVLMNGTPSESAGRQGPQAEIDAIFRR
jgi:hypothetical protein